MSPRPDPRPVPAGAGDQPAATRAAASRRSARSTAARFSRVAALLPVAVVALLLAGCGGSATPAPQTPADRPAVSRDVAPLEPALSVTDPRGTTVTVPAPPKRVVCLTGLCDDMVVELGLTPAGTSTPALLKNPVLLGDRAAQVPTVKGSFGSEDVESIAALRPDLVIGLGGVHEPLRAAIERFAPLWLVQPTTWEESVGYLRNLGSLTGRTAEATAGEQRFRTTLADGVEQARATGQADRKVLLMYGSADTIGVDTTDTVNGNLLATLYDYPFVPRGADVETASTYSVEEILAQAPDVVFAFSLLFSSADRTLTDQLADNPVWQQVPAVQARQVHEMDPRLWGSGRGTRSLGAMVEQSLAVVPGR
ncbi:MULTISPECIES: ABC transporter substrate-binding protein [unclassified Pseudonocardia]|uniref:ABC transporter substrate-binding protein n=1 Tax=unclassified Pseudonocardia TaxID=2619320 RepID=UPI0009593E1D|nr:MULTISPECIES: ABC transporter substrate-binding protein [unclassified Pseudonocardia]OLM32379.1 periplasmic binding protein [Pseudonocardia sp. Ae717_Ps2]